MIVNTKGRSYSQGKSLDVDLRSLIIDHCVSSGGNPVNGYLPVTYKSIADTYRVSLNTVSKIWKNFCDSAQVNPDRKGGDRCSKLSEGDLELIEILKTVKGSIQLKEIYSVLEEIGDVESISLSSISRAVKCKLLSGKHYTRKRITHVAAERYTRENMMYTLSCSSTIYHLKTLLELNSLMRLELRRLMLAHVCMEMHLLENVALKLQGKWNHLM